MNTDHTRRIAEHMLDEIGLIEDRFVAEAASAYRPSHKPIIFRRVLILVAALVLSSCTLLTLFIGSSLLFGGAKNADPGEADNAYRDFADQDGAELGVADTVPSQSTGTTSATLAARLQGLKNQTAALNVSKNELTLGGNEPLVIWQYHGENTYRVQPLTAQEYDDLMRQTQGGTPYATHDDAAQVTVRVWLVGTDGTVVSPYLANTPETVTLFEYEPTQEPSAAFSDTLYEILTK